VTIKTKAANSTPPAIGDTLTAMKLEKIYDEHFFRSLRSLIDRMPHEKKKPQRYKVIGALPQPGAEYLALRTERHQTTIGDLVDEAYSAVEDLAEEMTNWRDNLPDGLRENSDKGGQVEEAANRLEEIRDDKPDVPEGIRDLKVIFLSHPKLKSREDRAKEAGSMLNTAANAIDICSDEVKELVAQECEECDGSGKVECGECGSEGLQRRGLQ
jgi:hypothetical protein